MPKEIEHYAVDGKIRVISSSMDNILIKQLVTNWIQYDKPDFYKISNKTIIGIEHFEYDAYPNTRKGSSLRHEENIIKKKANKQIVEKLKTQDTVTIANKVNKKPTEKSLRKNFTTVFINHYEKIEVYKKHLQEIDGNYNSQRMWFFAEDKTLSGSRFICRKNGEKQGDRPFIPIFFHDIEKLFIESGEIDGIIIGDYYNKLLIIVKRNKESLDSLKDTIGYAEGDQVFFYTPTICDFAIKIAELET